MRKDAAKKAATFARELTMRMRRGTFNDICAMDGANGVVADVQMFP
jgi:hypothetical protein